MDSQSPVSRMERTFWTVWNYITEAVSRLFRPDPAKVDSNSIQEAADDIEPTTCSHTESGNSGVGVNEEQADLAIAFAVDSCQPIVAWELCNTEIDFGAGEENPQNKTAVCEEGESVREAQVDQTGNDLLITKDAEPKEEEQKENSDRILYPFQRDQSKTRELDEYVEHVNTALLNLPDDAMTDDLEQTGRKTDAEEETDVEIVLDDQQMNKTMRSFQVKEDSSGMLLRGEKQDSQDPYTVSSLGVEETEVKFCMVTDLSLEEEGNMHIEEARMLKDESDAGVTYEAPVGEEVENSAEGMMKNQARQVLNQLQICEMSDRDFKEDPVNTLQDTTLHVELLMAHDKSNIVSDGEIIVVGREQMVAECTERRESEKVEDRTEKVGETEQSIEIEKQHVNKSTDKAQEQGEDMEADTEDIQADHIVTEMISDAVTQDVKTELHRAEFKNEEEAIQAEIKINEKDAVEKKNQDTMIDKKCDMTATDVPVEEGHVDTEEDQVVEETVSSEEEQKENYMEVTCTHTAVTVKPESKEEISREFKKGPLGTCEGLVVVSQELNSPACEETQEGVPEYNNGHEPNENTTQCFLEVVGHYEEIQRSQLPEEVETKEQDSLQNSSSNSEADHLLQKDHMEEDQDTNLQNTAHIERFEVDVEEHAGIMCLIESELPQETEKSFVEPAIQASGHLFLEEARELSDNSMKTEIQQSEKEFETHVYSADEADQTTEELHDEIEELLVESEISGGLCDTKEVEAGEIVGDSQEDLSAETAEDMFEFSDEILKISDVEVDVVNPEENNDRTFSLLEGITESGSMKQLVETDPELIEGRSTEQQGIATEMQDASLDMEEIVEMAAELMEGTDGKENEEFEINIEATLNAEAADESWQKDTQMISKGDMAELVEINTEGTGTLDDHETDEEILDMWIDTILSEDNDMEAMILIKTKEDEPLEVSEQLMCLEMHPSNEEKDKTPSEQTEKQKEQVWGANSGESGLASDVSSASESGILDQSPGTEAFQDIHDMLDTISESIEISELSNKQPESQDILIKRTDVVEQFYFEGVQSITETGFHHDSGVGLSETTYITQVSDKSQQKEDEGNSKSVETETRLQKESGPEVTESSLTKKTDWRESEETDIKMMSLINVEHIKIEDEPLKSVSDCGNYIKQVDLRQADETEEIKHEEHIPLRGRNESEAWIEEGIVVTDSGSQSETNTESQTEPIKFLSLDNEQTENSAVIDESLHVFTRDEVSEDLRKKPEDHCEVDSSTLDFTAQRSRIAVKNPCVRPPKDPRSLLEMPSLEPTPTPRLPVKAPAGVPLGGLGIGIKLPGLGGGFPVLKKTQRVVRDENQENTLQEHETQPDEKGDTPKQDEVQPKPKWMPPRHPGFGNPLMSELKTKLKKTTKE
ncbi:hypothetical protein LDENG_00295890 [Lucifuga dentata]|nr:hypothetical protein LDENG_00295890 [Lucifuga dentata]